MMEEDAFMSNHEIIKSKILAGEYKQSSFGTEWAGAGAAITADPSSRHLSDKSITAICTKNAAALVWLTVALKEVANIDFLSKYQFYPTIVQAAKNYISTNGEDDAEGLLLAALEAVKEYV